MTWDITAGRVKVGLKPPDGSQDVEITAAMNAALAFAEHYCDRRFLFARETLTKYLNRDMEGVFVDRYPITRVHGMSGNGLRSIGAAAKYATHNSAGVIYLKHHNWAFGNDWANDGTVTVDYEGGYKTLPADLEYALWSIFGALWPTFDPSSVSTGGGVSVAIGAVKKRSIVGVGSVEYETGGGGTTSTGGVLAADWSAVMPGSVQALLSLYVRRVA